MEFAQPCPHILARPPCWSPTNVHINVIGWVVKAAQPKSLASNLFLISYKLYMQTIEVSIFSNVRPGMRLFGWELCPTFDLEMISQCPFASLHIGSSWWRRAHGFKICLQEGHQEENDDPWCEPGCELEQNGPKTQPKRHQIRSFKATEVSLSSAASSSLSSEVPNSAPAMAKMRAAVVSLVS